MPLPRARPCAPAGSAHERSETPDRSALRRRGRLGVGIALLGLALAGGRAADPAPGGELGLPFTRFYSFEEIGNASRGMRLDFDPLGRIAVARAGSCIVLNDTSWIDIADREDNGRVMERLVFSPAKDAFYGAFGTWGHARLETGKLRPQTLTPADAPAWALKSNFNELLALHDGTYFASLNGLVHWDRASGRQSYLEIPGVARLFHHRDQLYVSSYVRGLCAVDVVRGTVQMLREPVPEGAEVDQVAAFDAERVITTNVAGLLRFFDGREFSAFPGPLGEQALGRVSALVRLPDGNLAVAVNGSGVHIVTPDGRVLLALTTSEYQRVTDLASRENGVLWVVTETGIEKILYNSPLTVFGQRQGLPLSWPQLVRWNERIVVASGGRLYAAVDGRPGETTRFELMGEQPASAVWAIATVGEELIVGTYQGLYVRRPGGGFETVLTGMDVARLVPVDDVLYVLGATEITALRRTDGVWSECAPRVPGVGYPMIVHGSRHAAWMELGPNRAARVRLHDGRLHVRVFDEFPWKASRWINIGWAGDMVALTGLPDGRIYFDEVRETIVPRPELGRMLDQAPFPLNRFRQDAAGTIWATHDDGLLTLRVQDGQPVFETGTFGRINDRFPLVQLLPGGDVWLLTGQSIYHLNRNFLAKPKPAFRPVLVSLTTGRAGRELLARPGPLPALPTLAHADNSLVLRFFAGSYASRQPPAYEFRLHHGAESTVVVGNGSLLTLNNLPEGRYQLEARLSGAFLPASPPLFVEFTLAPPWYRTWYAYAGYLLGLAALLRLLLRWTTQRARSQNVILEQVVAERTGELRIAMQRLNDETRQTATLAERNRLAGEIHDSVQQGLSGLMLHLDATLKLPGLPEPVRTRLSVARNMVSFTRHEVQHAVWDMESPILEGTELGEALKKITALIDPGTAEVQVTIEGPPAELPSSTKHHLLRIAQEAITNAVRHAAARTITITLAYEAGGVALRVADDGNGFVPQAVLSSGFGHFGLRGLRGRAEKVGGDLQITSTPGQGTVVSVTVRTPLPVV